MAEQLELFDGNQEPEETPAITPTAPVHPKNGPDKALTEIAAKFARGLQLPGLAETVQVKWNARMRTAAGRAFFKNNTIELNPKLQSLPDDKGPLEIQNTFLHELAHLVSFARSGGKRIQPHGPEWKQACADLGIPGEDRCHELDFQPRRLKKRYAYECLSCGTIVERVRKLKRTVACFHCCKTHNRGRFDKRFLLVEKTLSPEPP